MLCVSLHQLCVCLELGSGWLHTNSYIVNSAIPQNAENKKPVTRPITGHTRTHFNKKVCSEGRGSHIYAFINSKKAKQVDDKFSGFSE